MSAADATLRLGDRVAASERHASGEADRGPARYLDAGDGSGRRVGFITPLSEVFCDDCNRVRITARGDIRACLASRRAVSLRDLARAGATDEALAWAVRWSLLGKDAGHHFLEPDVEEHEHVGMSLIGG
jgi:cyclic pyranopterin phosphate synthase